MRWMYFKSTTFFFLLFFFLGGLSKSVITVFIQPQKDGSLADQNWKFYTQTKLPGVQSIIM